MGAVAAAIGLALGLALPLTETETELMSEAAGSLRTQIEDAAKETVGSIKETASEILDSAEQGSKTATANRS